MAESAEHIDPHGRIVTGLAEVEPKDSAVCIGLFDGVHRGHQTIIRRAVRHAAQQAMRSVVVTFDRHPMEVVRPGSQPKMLTTLARRARTLAELGVDLVVVLPFDDELRHLAADEFVDHALVQPLQARHVVVGANFRFGHKAAGDVAMLSELGPTRGFGVEGVTLLELDGVVVSSTEIRALLERGEVERAGQMLGRPPLVDGVVVRGDRRGAGLGFPTANLQVPRRMAAPAPGIYAGCFQLPDGTAHLCATSVGTNPTFGGQERRIESHLLDYAGDLYGMAAAVDFRHRLHDEIRFDSVDALVEQIRDDVERTRALLTAEHRLPRARAPRRSR